MPKHKLTVTIDMEWWELLNTHQKAKGSTVSTLVRDKLYELVNHLKHEKRLKEGK